MASPQGGRDGAGGGGQAPVCGAAPGVAMSARTGWRRRPTAPSLFTGFRIPRQQAALIRQSITLLLVLPQHPGMRAAAPGSQAPSSEEMVTGRGRDRTAQRHEQNETGVWKGRGMTNAFTTFLKNQGTVWHFVSRVDWSPSPCTYCAAKINHKKMGTKRKKLSLFTFQEVTT